MENVVIEKEEKETSEKVVCINRVAKVAKGGRRFSFSALAVVGDQAGSIGLGLGKANEVPDAVRKAIEAARKNMFFTNITKKGAIPHAVLGRFKASKVILQPASSGTGLIADESVRAVLAQVGVNNVFDKGFRI